MALLEDITKGATPGNLTIGIGAALLAPVLAPALASVLRPAVKAAMRTGIMLYRGALEPVSAAVGALVAEARMELATEGHPVAAAAAPDEESLPRPHKRRGAQH